MVERDAGGDYGKAARSLHLKGVSANIMLAYDEARRSPTGETWRRLRDALVADLEALQDSTRA